MEIKLYCHATREFYEVEAPNVLTEAAIRKARKELASRIGYPVFLIDNLVHVNGFVSIESK